MARFQASRRGVLAAGELVERCISPVLAAQGFAASDVILAWPEIVGERLARHTEPMQVLWPRRTREQAKAGQSSAARTKKERTQAGETATLVVRVTSAFALDLQHMAPVIVERVNTHFGWRCVGALALRQGPIQRRPVQRQPNLHLTQENEQAVMRTTAGIEDERLRLALEKLGRAVLARPVNG